MTAWADGRLVLEGGEAGGGLSVRESSGSLTGAAGIGADGHSREGLGAGVHPRTCAPCSAGSALCRWSWMDEQGLGLQL